MLSPVFADLVDAQASITDYFVYYNHDSLHSSIRYQTPYRTHRQLLQTIALSSSLIVPSHYKLYQPKIKQPMKYQVVNGLLAAAEWRSIS